MNGGDLSTIRRSGIRERLHRWTPYLLITPAAFLLLSMLVYPIVQTIYMSFWKWPYLEKAKIKFIGFANYVELFTVDEAFINSLIFTLLFTAVTIGTVFICGLASALILENIKAFRNLLRSTMILPYMIAPIAVGQIWRLLWARDFGLVNYFLSIVGLGPVTWLGAEGPAFWAVVISEVWRSTPFVTLILLAGLDTIPLELYEAAKSDGASVFHVFRHIKLPLLLPAITVALIFQTIFKLRVFGLIFTLTGGGPGKTTTPLGIMIQRTYFRYFEGGYSAAIAVILFLIGGFFSVLYMKMVYREVEY